MEYLVVVVFKIQAERIVYCYFFLLDFVYQHCIHLMSFPNSQIWAQQWRRTFYCNLIFEHV